MTDLSGRCAVITGSLERTGFGVAQALARCGARVILHGRKADERCRVAQDRFEAEFGQRPQFLVGDITDPEVCQGLASQTKGVDILVNNVGVYRPTELAQASAEHWRWTIAGNLDSSFYMAQAFMDQLLESGRGRLIQLGYVTCDQVCARAEFPAYQIAKTGVHILTLSYAQRYAHRGLTANTVSPGQLANSIDLETAGALPTGRPGEVDEIAAAVVYLASSEAAYVSGTNVNVAGSWAPASARYEDGL